MSGIRRGDSGRGGDVAAVPSEVMSSGSRGESRAPVSLVVGGENYRLLASVPDETLRRLAQIVDARIKGMVPPGKPIPPTAVLLAAIALANDLEDERAQRLALEAKGRDVLRRLLARIDEALEPPADASGGAEHPSP